MDRKAIHEQISSLLDKLTFLNERLSHEKSLHPVEVDLLNGYMRELQTAMENLGRAKHELRVVEKEAVPAPPPPAAEQVLRPVVEEKSNAVAEEPVKPVLDEKAPGPVAEKKADSELKMHQHINEKAETAVIADDPEALTEDEKVVVAPKIKIQSTEEILARKKPSTKLLDKQDETASLGGRFKKDTAALADKLKGSKKKNLKDMFDLNERYAFIENLFGGSAEKFNRAVQDLGKCSSREQAEQYIKDVESKFAWSEKPDLAQRFSGQVFELIG